MQISDFIRVLQDRNLIELSGTNLLLQKLQKEESKDEVNQSIVNFVIQYCDPSQDLDENTIRKFIFVLETTTLSENLKKLIFTALIQANIKFFETTKPEIERCRERLLSAMNEGNYSRKKFDDLILTNEAIYQRWLCLTRIYSVISLPIEENANLINLEIPYTLNVLNLLGKLKPSAGINLNKPFQEMNRAVKPGISGKGIKDENRFYKIKVIQKMGSFLGSNVTALAFDNLKQKKMFVRLNPNREISDLGESKINYSGLFASKIARRISKKHFSSERFLTNKDIASRALPGYQRSVVTDDKKIDERILKHPSILPGLGIIDETCLFVGEQDRNLENIGISVADEKESVKDAYFTKIDFSECELDRPFDVSSSSFRSSLYENRKPNADQYELERLETRIKLALFTPELLRLDAEKTFPDEKSQNKMLGHFLSRNKNITQLLNDESEEIIKKKISIAKIHYEIIHFFTEHDSKKLSFEQCETVLNKTKEKADSLIRMVYKDNVDEYRKQSYWINHNHHAFLNQFKHTKQTFYQRNKKDIAFGAGIFGGTGTLLTIGLAIAINAIPVIGQLISFGMFIGIGIGMIAGGAVVGAASMAGICKMDEKSTLATISPTVKTMKKNTDKNKINPIQSRFPQDPSQKSKDIRPQPTMSTTSAKGLFLPQQHRVVTNNHVATNRLPSKSRDGH